MFALCGVALNVGETDQPTLSILPDNAFCKTVVWTSSDTSVAKVDKYSGLITAVSDGFAIITARAIADNVTSLTGGAYTTISVTVGDGLVDANFTVPYKVIYDSILPLKSAPSKNANSVVSALTFGQSFMADADSLVTEEGTQWIHAQLQNGMTGYVDIANNRYCIATDELNGYSIDEYEVVYEGSDGLFINKKYNVSNSANATMNKGMRFWAYTNTTIHAGNYDWAYSYCPDVSAEGWVAISDDTLCVRIDSSDSGQFYSFQAEMRVKVDEADLYTEPTSSATSEHVRTLVEGDSIQITGYFVEASGFKLKWCVTDSGYYILSDYLEIVSCIVHTPGEWETTQEATLSSNGFRELRCTVCGELLQSETIPKLNGEVVEYYAKASTNIRSDASVSASVVGSISKGSHVWCWFDEQIEADGYTWGYCYTESGTEGWVAISNRDSVTPFNSSINRASDSITEYQVTYSGGLHILGTAGSSSSSIFVMPQGTHFWAYNGETQTKGSHTYYYGFVADGTEGWAAIAEYGTAVTGTTLSGPTLVSERMDEETEHIYRLYQGSVNWEYAKNYAASIGDSWQLACIDDDSVNEQSIIEDMVISYNYACWLGGHNLTGSWQWLSGMPISTSDSRWDDGEPSGKYGSSTENYLGIYANNTQTSYSTTRKWNDFQLTSSTIKGFVVEYTPPVDYGSDTTWILDNDGVLTIPGMGIVNSDRWDYFGYDTERVRTAIIEYGVTSIGDYSFEGCSNLVSVTIPESVENIGDLAFAGCNLTQVTIPEGVIRIGEFAFQSNPLRSVVLPASLTTISNGVFWNCSDLTDVYYGGSEEEWASVNVDINNESLLNATMHYDAYKATSMRFFDGPNASWNMWVGDTIELAYDIVFEPESASNQEIVFPEFDDGVIRVDEYGVVTALQYGESQYTFYLADNPEISDTIYLFVNSKASWDVDNVEVDSNGNVGLYISVSGQGYFTDFDFYVSYDASEQFEYWGAGAPIPFTVIEASALKTGADVTVYTDENNKQWINVSYNEPVQTSGQILYVKLKPDNMNNLWSSTQPYTATAQILCDNYKNGEFVGSLWLCYDDDLVSTFEVEYPELNVMLQADLVLPSSLQIIEDEAMAGVAAKSIRLSDGITRIGSKAFADCNNLQQIYIPEGCNTIAADAFSGVSNLTIYGIDGSYAEFYAGKYGFAFVAVE